MQQAPITPGLVAQQRAAIDLASERARMFAAVHDTTQHAQLLRALPHTQTLHTNYYPPRCYGLDELLGQTFDWYLRLDATQYRPEAYLDETGELLLRVKRRPLPQAPAIAAAAAPAPPAPSRGAELLRLYGLWLMPHLLLGSLMFLLVH
jgi:hypothetical protein